MAWPMCFPWKHTTSQLDGKPYCSCKVLDTTASSSFLWSAVAKTSNRKSYMKEHSTLKAGLSSSATFAKDNMASQLRQKEAVAALLSPARLCHAINMRTRESMTCIFFRARCRHCNVWVFFSVIIFCPATAA